MVPISENGSGRNAEIGNDMIPHRDQGFNNFDKKDNHVGFLGGSSPPKLTHNKNKNKSMIT